MNTEILKRAAISVGKVFPDAHPRASLILGSGWGEIAEAFTVKQSLDYAEIPYLGATRIAGHPGHLILAECTGVELLVFQGRRHLYEGTGWDPIALPVYLSKAFGASVLILTNAAGGISAKVRAGDLMAVDDHINAIGANPLIGEHDPFWGPRFPDQTRVYDAGLRKILDNAAEQIGEKLLHGVYVAVSGPTYETPAEVAAFRTFGADAIGMSTVPEAILGSAAGLRVAALSCISNMAAGVSTAAMSHEQVVAEIRKVQPRMRALLVQFFRNLAPTFQVNNEQRIFETFA